MRRLRITRRADRDLEEVWAYIAQDSLRHADRFLELVQQKFWRLVDHPGIGPECPDIADELRCFPVGNYVIYYRSITDGVAVIRVLHAARDVAQFSFDEQEYAELT